MSAVNPNAFMANLKNKRTLYPNLVGAVCNRTGTDCLINSKVYHIMICSTEEKK